MPLFGRPSLQDQRKAQAYAEWMRRRNPLAIISLVLGVVSLVEFGVLLVFGIAGIVVGIIALRQLSSVDSQDPAARPSGHRLAIGGIVLSAVSLAFAAVLYLHRHGGR